MILSENTLMHAFLVIFRSNDTYIKVFKLTTHEVAPSGAV